jgi:hypothetical protein
MAVVGLAAIIVTLAVYLTYVPRPAAGPTYSPTEQAFLNDFGGQYAVEMLPLAHKACPLIWYWERGGTAWADLHAANELAQEQRQTYPMMRSVVDSSIRSGLCPRGWPRYG